MGAPGERAAVHRLLYNTATLERVNHRWPRPTTAYWKPNYRDIIGIYYRIDKTVYIPHKELCLLFSNSFRPDSWALADEGTLGCPTLPETKATKITFIPLQSLQNFA